MVFEATERRGRADDGTVQDSNDDYDFDTDPGRDTAVDVKLFKAIGLHQLLRNGRSVDHDGRGGGGGHPYRSTLRVAMCLWLGMQFVQAVGLYYTRADVQRSALMTVVLSTSFLDLYKGYLVAWNADRLRVVLGPAGGHDVGGWLHRCRADVSVVLRVFTACSFGVDVAWLTMPWLLLATGHDDRYVPFIHTDGTVSQYRSGVLNLWIPVTAAVYNDMAVWPLVWLVEALGCSLNVFTWMLFDCFVITMCYTLHAQFRNASAVFATLGRATRRSTAADIATSWPAHRTGGVADRRQIREPIRIYLCAVVLSAGYTCDNRPTGTNYDLGPMNSTRNKNKNVIILGVFMELDADTYHYNELIRLIKYNKKITKKFDDFFDLVRPVVLAQISLGSYSVMILIFLTALTYAMGWPILSVTFLKFFGGFFALVVELYLYCYLFNYVETAKATVNFGLYSCNWTEMSLKFKKTLLLEMCLNSSHRRAMKVSPMSIVNLEMFTGVMRMSYSIVSVLLNAQK